MPYTEKQLANLKPGIKGMPSRNPNGRPKGSPNKKTVLGKILYLKAMQKNPLTGKKEKITYLEMMFLVQIKQAIAKGDVASFRALMERFEGTALKYSEMLSLEMMQSGWGGDDPNAGQAAPAGTTIIRKIVFRTQTSTTADQIVNE